MAWAGLIGGSIVWRINTQLGEILPNSDCIGRHHFSAIVSFAGAVIVLAASALSRHLDGRTFISAEPNLSFSSRLSALAGLVFSFTLLLQGTASLVLSGCER